MPKRKRVDDQPMSDAEYQQFQELQHFDAASLRALALWLNTKKKNAALMKAVTAEMGRNARHMARAVDYFRPYFTDQSLDTTTSSEYLMLFEYSKLKHEDAINLCAKYRFTTPLYQLRDIVRDARRNGHGAKQATLACLVADSLAAMKLAVTAMTTLGNQLNWDGVPHSFADAMNGLSNQYDTGAIDVLESHPAVALVLAKRGKAEK